MASQLNPRAKQIMEMAKAKGVEICLPVDFVVSNKFGEDGEIKVTNKAEVRRPLHKPSTLNPQPSTPPLSRRLVVPDGTQRAGRLISQKVVL